MGKYNKDLNTLKKIISYCDEIEAITARFGHSIETFRQDSAYRHACSMCILQIGELTTRFTDTFKDAHSNIPWVAIKAIRNLFVHAYGGINIELTWQIIEHRVLELKTFCLEALKDFEIAL